MRKLIPMMAQLEMPGRNLRVWGLGLRDLVLRSSAQGLGLRDPLGCQFLRQVPESTPLSEAEDQRDLALGFWIHSVFGAYAMNVCLSRNSSQKQELW